MLGEGLEKNIEVSHDTLGSYSDIMCGEGRDSLRGPGYGGDTPAGRDRGRVRVPQYEDESSFIGKIHNHNNMMTTQSCCYLIYYIIICGHL